jgi:hypothetical protein
MDPVCQACQQSFSITAEDLAFYQKVSPIFRDQTVPVTPPTHCPSCRAQRRLLTRNNYTLYNRPCSRCQKTVIAIYAADKTYPVYCKECWWSDHWDASEFATSYDFKQPFFTQFAALQQQVPRLALINREAENSDYVHYASHNKNCYLIFNADSNQDCYYCDSIDDCRDSMDLYWSASCELSYEIVSGHTCYNSQYCLHSADLSDCYFCDYCYDCHDCFGCFGLSHKQYYIYNKPYSAEEYKKKIAELFEQKGSYQGLQNLKKTVQDFFLTLPHRYATITDSSNCTGDFIHRCQNCQECYHVTRAQDCKYISDGGVMKDAYDGNFCGYKNSELFYEVQDCWFGYRMLFSTTCWNCYEMYYSDHCFYSNNCFGCIGLKRKQYCILNKQYSKEEYEQLVPRIIAQMTKNNEWGEFFPASLSPFKPEETVAYQKAAGISISTEVNLPDHIKDVADDIIHSPIACTTCDRSYLTLPQELKFYREHTLPLPRHCFVCRQKNRTAALPAHHLYKRHCQACKIAVQSPFPPTSPEIIFCDECYQRTRGE